MEKENQRSSTTEMEKENRKSSATAAEGLIVPAAGSRRSSGVDVGSILSDSSSRRESGATAADKSSGYTSEIDATPSKATSGIPQLKIDPGSQSEAESVAAPAKSPERSPPAPGEKSPSPKKKSPIRSRIKEGLRKVRKSLSPKRSEDEDSGKDAKISPEKSPERRKSSKSPEKSPRKSRFRSKSRSPGKADKRRSRDENESFMLGDELKRSSSFSDEDRQKSGDKIPAKDSGTDKDAKISPERRKSSKSPEKSPRKSGFRSKSRSPGKADKRSSREENESFMLGDELRPFPSFSDEYRQKSGDKIQAKDSRTDKGPKISPERRKSSKSPEKSPKILARFRRKSRSPGKVDKRLSGEGKELFMLGDELRRSSTSSDDDRQKSGDKIQAKDSGTDKDRKISPERRKSKSPEKSPKRSRRKSRYPGKVDKRFSCEETEPFILGDELRRSPTSSGDDRPKATEKSEEDTPSESAEIKALREDYAPYFTPEPTVFRKWSPVRASPKKEFLTSPEETDLDSLTSFEDSTVAAEAVAEREISSAGEPISKRLDLGETSKGSSGSESPRRTLSKRQMKSEAADGGETAKELPDPGPSPRKQPKIIGSEAAETESKYEKSEHKSDSEDDKTGDKSRLLYP